MNSLQGVPGADWVGTVPTPPETPVHYHWHDASPYTACGASRPHHNLTETTDGNKATCPECVEYLRRESEAAHAAHDCTRDGHDYEMIHVADGTLVALTCDQCGSQWKVDPK